MTGTLVNRNNFATLTVLLIPALLACHRANELDPRDRRWSSDNATGRASFHAICGGLMGLALLFSKSRAGISTGVLSVIGLTLIIRCYNRSIAGRSLGALPLGLIAMVLSWTLYIGIDSVAGAVSQAGRGH